MKKKLNIIVCISFIFGCSNLNSEKYIWNKKINKKYYYSNKLSKKNKLTENKDKHQVSKSDIGIIKNVKNSLFRQNLSIGKLITKTKLIASILILQKFEVANSICNY
ncbi:MAG: hypothetical protein GY830_09445, partial [Bacteroidetes bacterium]|nr:hypothetical protein [Bacteroidota bacterium]